MYDYQSPKGRAPNRNSYYMHTFPTAILSPSELTIELGRHLGSEVLRDRYQRASHPWSVLRERTPTSRAAIITKIRFHSTSSQGFQELNL